MLKTFMRWHEVSGHILFRYRVLVIAFTELQALCGGLSICVQYRIDSTNICRERLAELYVVLLSPPTNSGRGVSMLQFWGGLVGH